MSAMPLFIGVDWGNSNARFFLIAEDGGLIATRNGPGIGQIDDAAAIEAICFEIIGDWLAHVPALSVMMAGAVGSNIGWHQAGYADTPATLADVAAGIVMFRARDVAFMVAPGIATIRSDGLPDVMRGEEIQVFGSVGSGDALLCLPGTHSKWVQSSNGAITEFHSAPTGELLEIIGRYSMLLNPKRPVLASPDTVFLDAVEVAQRSSAGFESLLIAVRSQQIMQRLKPEAADSYLAGLAIGCEIKSALPFYSMAPSEITLVGSPHLTALYAAALTLFGYSGRQIDGDAASYSGLCKLYQTWMA